MSIPTRLFAAIAALPLLALIAPAAAAQAPRSRTLDSIDESGIIEKRAVGTLRRLMDHTSGSSA